MEKLMPLRILHVTSVLNYGGIETFLLNIFKNIDKSKVIFDFLVIREDKGILEDEIKTLGGKIFKIQEIKKSGYFKFKKNLFNFFASHPEYNIVHSHVNTLNGLILQEANRCGVKRRISHAHTAFPKYSFFKGLIKNYFKTKISNNDTDFFSCSENAGKWLHKNNTAQNIIITNGITIENFLFSEEKRIKKRSELNLDDKFVLLNIGRFSKEKNHIFLLDLLKQISQVKDNTILICIGKGKTHKNILKYSKKLKVQHRLLLVPPSNNILEYLCASDVYIAPSLFEGFGISAAEAQCNSLPCILSDNFPKEVAISNNVVFLSLNESREKWINEIISSKRYYNFSPNDKIITNYHTSNVAKKLTAFYLSTQQ